MPALRAPGTTVRALGAGVAVAALLFPPMFVIREGASLRDLLAAMAAALLGVTEVSGLKLLDLARHLDQGTRDPVFIGWVVATAAAVLALGTASRPRWSRGCAVVGLAGAAAMAIVPRVVAADDVSVLGQVVRASDPALGFYGALAGLTLVVLGGATGGG